jgi:hypothetical protein
MCLVLCTADCIFKYISLSNRLNGYIKNEGVIVTLKNHKIIKDLPFDIVDKMANIKLMCGQKYKMKPIKRTSMLD